MCFFLANNNELLRAYDFVVNYWCEQGHTWEEARENARQITDEGLLMIYRNLSDQVKFEKPRTMFDFSGSKLLMEEGCETNIAVALRVLELVDQMISPEVATKCHVNAYCNGREQGFVLAAWLSKEGWHMAWSENRNSDDIVVYSGPGLYCSFGGSPWGTTDKERDAEYNTGKYFRHDKMSEAAEYIVKSMTEHYEEWKMEATNE